MYLLATFQIMVFHIHIRVEPFWAYKFIIIGCDVSDVAACLSSKQDHYHGEES